MRTTPFTSRSWLAGWLHRRFVGPVAFTLIELLVVIAIVAIVAALLLPSLSAAKSRALRRSMNAVAPPPAAPAAPQSAEPVHPGLPQRNLATVKTFWASVSLKPGLSVGTADPESIYTAQLSSKFLAFNPAKSGECEISLPLPPQIISLADLEVTVNSQPSESVGMLNGKLTWVGTLPAEPTPMTITYSAVGKGLYDLQLPPSAILDTFHINLTAVGSGVRMLELSLQPSSYVRSRGQTIYTWDYKHLLFGRPIALDVLGVAPIDRLGELTWLGPSSVVIFGLVLGLFAWAFKVQNVDRWMLLLIVGTFMGAYPLMYFAQEFIPLTAAILTSSAVVLLVIAIRSVTIMGWRLGLLGTVLPATSIMAVTLMVALHPALKGILITCVVLALFILLMLLLPRVKFERSILPASAAA